MSGTRFVHQQKCLLALHKIYRGAAGTKGLNIMMMLNNVAHSLDACLPIVDVPVHTVMGMPMTEGMGMPVAFIMGTKKS